jgi:urease accessory protein
MDSSPHVVRKLNEIGRAGSVELVFAVKNGKTVIGHAYTEVPFKVTHLYYPPDSLLPQLILMNTTAGLFPGDRLDVRILVKRGARVLITSQASTKVHPGTGIAEQSVDVTVEAGAELHLYNDPLIPFRGASLRQRVGLSVWGDGRLYFWEAFMAGRVGSNETWKFNEIATELKLCRDGKLSYLERYRLDPRLDQPVQPWVMHDSVYVATGIICDPAAKPPEMETGTNLAIDEPLHALWIARIVAKSGIEYRQLQRRAFACAFAMRGIEVPDLRKY